MDNRTTNQTISPVQVIGEIPIPRITMWGVTIVLVMWWVYALIISISSFQSYQIPFFPFLLWQTVQSLIKFLLSLPVWFIVIRWMHKRKWYWKGFAHVFLGPMYALVNYMAMGLGSGVQGESQPALGWGLIYNLFIYVLQFTFYHGYDILRKLRFREKTTLELLALQKERELEILKSQINPTFLFNTLDSISAMSSTNVEKTRTMIAQLGDMLRYVIESGKKSLLPLQNELQFVKDYIDLESKRMGNRLVVEFQIDQSLALFPVPPMILQPLVENAIKHGIAPLAKGGKVNVHIKQEKEMVVFRVSDTRVGLSVVDPLTTDRGIGLKNTDTRLRKIYGDLAGLKIISLKDSGYEVTFKLPSK